MEDASDILDRLPAKLRAARRDLGLSLEAVARLSGVSRSMVSQIERGESSPTIATLWNLTRALRVDFAGLLEEDGDPRRIEVLRDAGVPTIDNRGTKCRLRILSPPSDAGRYEIYDLRFGPAGRLVSQPHRSGTREHLTVLEGQIAVWAGDLSERLGPGDTARYPADVAHRLEAAEDGARALLIVMGPAVSAMADENPE